MTHFLNLLFMELASEEPASLQKHDQVHLLLQDNVLHHNFAELTPAEVIKDLDLKAVSDKVNQLLYHVNELGNSDNYCINISAVVLPCIDV